MTLSKTFLNLFFNIDQIIFGAFTKVYELFNQVSKINIFGYDILDDFINNFFVVLGLFLVLFISYKLIALIIDPTSQASTQKIKTVISKSLIAILLIILIPLIFDYMHIFQVNLIESNFINNMILGTRNDGEVIDDTAAINLALSLSSVFYHPVNDKNEVLTVQECKKDDVSEANPICNDYVGAYQDAIDNNTFEMFYGSTELRDNVPYKSWGIWDKNKDGSMKYTPILSTAAGLFGLWFMLNIAIYAATRIFKLGVLQIVAPVIIIKNIVEDDKLTDTKWFKEITQTYASLFVYLATISFVFYLASILPELVSATLDAFDGNPIFINLILLLGLLKFGKDLPEIMKSVFSGNKGFLGKLTADIPRALSPKKTLGSFGKIGASAIGGAATLGTSRWKSADVSSDSKMDKTKRAFSTASGTVKGAFSGGYRAYKADDKETFTDTVKASQSEVVSQERARVMNKGIVNRGRGIFNDITGKNSIEALDTTSKQLKSAQDSLEGKKVKEIKTEYNQLNKNIETGSVTDMRVLENVRSTQQENLQREIITTTDETKIADIQNRIQRLNDVDNIKNNVNRELVLDPKLQKTVLSHYKKQENAKVDDAIKKNVERADKSVLTHNLNKTVNEINLQSKSLPDAEVKKVLKDIGYEGLDDFKSEIKKVSSMLQTDIKDPEVKKEFEIKVVDMTRDLGTVSKGLDGIKDVQQVHQHFDPTSQNKGK